MREVLTHGIQQSVGCNERCGQRPKVLRFGGAGRIERRQLRRTKTRIELRIHFRENAGRGLKFLATIPRHRKSRTWKGPPESDDHAPRGRVTREVVWQFHEREVGCPEQMDMVIRRNLRGLDSGADDIGGLSRGGLHRRFRDRHSLVFMGQIAQSLSGVRVPHVDQTVTECRSQRRPRVIQIALPRFREHMAIALDHQTLESIEKFDIAVDVPLDPVARLVGVWSGSGTGRRKYLTLNREHAGVHDQGSIAERRKHVPKVRRRVDSTHALVAAPRDVLVRRHQ